MLTAPIRIFLSSFLILFLEVALIRWLPAQIRLLSYFSNFILLAAFLGIGIGSLLGRMKALRRIYSARSGSTPIGRKHAY